MRYIAFMLMLFAPVCNSLDIVFGGISKHIGPQKYRSKGSRKRFNGKHNLIAIGVDYAGYSYSVAKFKNSYYIDSYAVSVLKRFKQIRYGLTIATGYDKFNKNDYQKYQPAITVRYDYKNLSFITLGNAASVSIKISL